MTKRLYQDDSYAVHFEADVVNNLSVENFPAVELDQTLFYPTSGGQLHDTGTINSVSVIDVVEENNTIIHILETQISTKKVSGEIDWNRRLDHMQQHSGQHILSASLMKSSGIETLSVAFGEKCSTIDLNTDTIFDSEISDIENNANDWVFRNVPIKILYPTAKQVETLPLRKISANLMGKKIRVINIEGLDYSACGGTHCSTTGEVGIIKIRSWEKVRGKVRLEFYCGIRALHDYQNKTGIVNSLKKILSTHELNIADMVTKQLIEKKTLSRRLLDLKNQLFVYSAKEIFKKGENIKDHKIIIYNNEQVSINDLQILLKQIFSNGECIIFSVCEGGAFSFVRSEADKNHANMSELLKVLKMEFDISGGGGETKVQGRVKEGTDIPHFLQRTKELFVDSI